MIGIDLVSIARIQKACEKFGDDFLNRFLSKSEQMLCQKANHKINFERVASFWAIKEAASKALGVGIGQELSFLDLEISKSPKGAPCLALREEKMHQFSITSLSVSVTHDQGLAIAVVHMS